MSDQRTIIGTSAAPLDEAIGLTRADDDGEWTVLRWDPHPVSVGATDPVAYLHGGAIATCVDTASWEAIVRESEESWVAADLRVDFIKLARPEPHRVRSIVRKAGRKQAVVDVEISAWNSPERVVALGRVLLARVG